MIAERSTTTTRILLVEDNPGDADLVREHLGEVPDGTYELDHVTEIEKAVEKLGKDPFDVLLVDLGLPDSTGLESVKRVHAVADDIPIIVLTGLHDEDTALRCIEAGAEDYLRKAEIGAGSLRRAIGFAVSRRREATILELRETLDRYRGLSSSGTATSITRKLSGAGPIRERVPEQFAAIEEAYRGLFNEYLDQLIRKAPKPLRAMNAITAQIGDMGGGPRDLIDVHVAALDQLVDGIHESRARAYTVEGRLLAIEMMGLLVDYYRVGIRRARPQGEDR